MGVNNSGHLLLLLNYLFTALTAAFFLELYKEMKNLILKMDETGKQNVKNNPKVIFILLESKI